MKTTENQRFEELIKSLITSKKIRNQQQFVEEIRSDKATVSQIKNGKIKIPNNLFSNIESAFPDVSMDWLKEGKGDMLNNDKYENIVNGSNNISIAGKGNQVNSDTLLEIIESQQKGYLDIIRTNQKQLTESQTQISRLISVVEKLNNKLS